MRVFRPTKPVRHVAHAPCREVLESQSCLSDDGIFVGERICRGFSVHKQFPAPARTVLFEFSLLQRQQGDDLHFSVVHNDFYEIHLEELNFNLNWLLFLGIIGLISQMYRP